MVALFVLSIFAVSVPLANRFAGKTEAKPAQDQSTPAQDPTAPPKQWENDEKICWSEVYTVTVPIADGLSPGAAAAKAQSQWLSEVGSKFGPEFADWEHKGSGVEGCTNLPLVRQSCEVA